MIVILKESKNQFYAPYWEWEDYQHGMYKSSNGGDINQALLMFSTKDICYSVMREVTQKWLISTKVNLTNLHCNRRAWLGQAASCLYANLTQEETCEAWKMLNDEQREVANQIADEVIREWEKTNERDIEK